MLTVFIVIILLVGFAGVIGNQYSGLRRMESLQRSLDEIIHKLREMNKQ